MRSPHTTTREKPPLLQQPRPITAKNKYFFKYNARYLNTKIFKMVTAFRVYNVIAEETYFKIDSHYYKWSRDDVKYMGEGVSVIWNTVPFYIKTWACLDFVIWGWEGVGRAVLEPIPWGYPGTIVNRILALRLLASSWFSRHAFSVIPLFPKVRCFWLLGFIVGSVNLIRQPVSYFTVKLVP